MRQCTSPGDKIGKPCAITEWGWQWELQSSDQKCPANNDTSRKSLAEATAGDYNHLLQTAMRWFEVD
jgi:hypothetical protein